MKTIDKKDIQKLEFNILKEFKKYCEKNNIGFFLVGGTLLGAIRHQGFIPWDDDIDVGMMRVDYNKLIEKVKKDPFLDKKKRYKVLLPLEENHIYPYIKIVDTNTIAYEKYINKKYATGLWVDVFPYDYGADVIEEIKKLNKKQKRYKLFFKVGISGELSTFQKMKKAIAYPVYKLFTKGNYTHWVKKILRLPTAHKTKYVGDVVWMYDERDMYPTEWFDELIDVTFEGEKFRATAYYDEYLTQFYGDYMKLPKEEDRIFHGFECYYLDKEDKK